MISITTYFHPLVSLTVSESYEACLPSGKTFSCQMEFHMRFSLPARSPIIHFWAAVSQRWLTYYWMISTLANFGWIRRWSVLPCLVRKHCYFYSRFSVLSGTGFANKLYVAGVWKRMSRFLFRQWSKHSCLCDIGMYAFPFAQSRVATYDTKTSDDIMTKCQFQRKNSGKFTYVFYKKFCVQFYVEGDGLVAWRSEQNDHHFTEDIFKCMFLKSNACGPLLIYQHWCIAI